MKIDVQYTRNRVVQMGHPLDLYTRQTTEEFSSVVFSSLVGETMHTAAMRGMQPALVRMFRTMGIQVDRVIEEEDWGLLFLANAVNGAAKAYSAELYDLKGWSVTEAIPVAHHHGWGGTGAFYLDHPEVGQVSFHFPGDDAPATDREYPYSWSGVPRQGRAIKALGSQELREHLARTAHPGWVRR